MAQILDESGAGITDEAGNPIFDEQEEQVMANVLTTPGVLTLDTTAVISTTNLFKIRKVVYAAPAAAVGAFELTSGGNLILTGRAPASGSFIVDFGNKPYTCVGLTLFSITALSNLTIYCD